VPGGEATTRRRNTRNPSLGGASSQNEPADPGQPTLPFARGFAVTVPAGSHHITFSFVPPGMNWAPVGLLAGVALMLVPTARSAFSFRVRR
jgi:hypothetical protein